MKPHPHRFAVGVVSAGLLASALTASTANAQQPPSASGAGMTAPAASALAAAPAPTAAPAPAGSPAPGAAANATLPSYLPDPMMLSPVDPSRLVVKEPQTFAPPAQSPQASPAQSPQDSERPDGQRQPAPHAVTVSPDRKPAAAAAQASPPPPAILDAMPADVPAGVPSFFIDSFRVPVFLLPIYQAAGIQYGVPWEVLAAINEIETDYGRNLNVSSAGAVGWMQFLPASWQSYGVDANGDGRADPANPIDAIFAAARYLQAAGAQADLGKAILAYNHAGWYVTSVLQRAQRLAALPAGLVGSLSGLAQGQPPVLGHPRRLEPPAARRGRQRSLVLSVDGGAPAVAVAVTDGRLTRIGHNRRLGRFVELRDGFGNTYTYGGLARVARRQPVLRSERAAAAAPAARSTAAAARSTATAPVPAPATPTTAVPPATPTTAAPPASAPGTQPGGPLGAIDWAEQARRQGIVFQAARVAIAQRPRASTYDQRLLGGVTAARVAYRPLREGSRVVAGTILGRASGSTTSPARVRFEVRPTGRGAPRIDPGPIVAGWKLLRASASGAAAPRPNVQRTLGQVLLLGKQDLQRSVLDNPDIAIYPCGRDDIRAGRIDRRVLATLQFLAASGMKPTVSALRCGHSRLTTAGNVSEHESGNAVDISAINGIAILGHQGPGSVAEAAIRQLLTLQGTMAPHQIISLMTFAGAPSTLALPDHADHIHVGFAPHGSQLGAAAFGGTLDAKGWRRLIDRLAAVGNPRVAASPSPGALAVVPQAAVPQAAVPQAGVPQVPGP